MTELKKYYFTIAVIFQLITHLFHAKKNNRPKPFSNDRGRISLRKKNLFPLPASQPASFDIEEPLPSCYDCCTSPDRRTTAGGRKHKQRKKKLRIFIFCESVTSRAFPIPHAVVPGSETAGLTSTAIPAVSLMSGDGGGQVNPIF